MEKNRDFLFPRRQPRIVEAGGGGGGGGGGAFINFTVVDVFCPGDYDNDDPDNRFYVEATVDAYSASCTAAPYGFDEYTNTIRVYDSCILQYYTEDQLLGIGTITGLPLSGFAVLMRPFRTGECVPYWECKSVCGEPTCGNSWSPPDPDEEEIEE
jgi:hypothetical protein